MRSRVRRLRLAAAVAVMLACLPVTNAAAVDGIDVQLPTGNRISGVLIGESGEPIDGYGVSACSPQGAACYSATADGGGAFTVRGLPAGVYVLQASPPGDGFDYLTAWYSEAGPVGTIELASQIDATTGDVGGLTIVLARGFRVEGRIVSPDGDPVGGVSIAASGEQGGAGAVSASDGRYSIRGVVPGSYRLLISAPGTDFIDGMLLEDGTVGTADDPAGRLVEVSADTAAIDVTLTRGLRVSGTLSGPGSASAHVHVFGASDRGGNVAPDGTWAVGGLLPGAHEVMFTPLLEDPRDSPFSLGYWRPDGVLADEAGVIELFDANILGLDAIVPARPTLSGSISDRGGPVAGLVFACAGGGCGVEYVGADGAFAFENVRPGTWLVQAGSSGHVPGYFGPGGFAFSDADATAVTLETTDVSGVDIVLPVGEQIRGRITGPSGEPVSGAFVSATQPDRGVSELGPGSGVTDANGEYVVSGLLAGEHRVWVSPPDPSDYFPGYYDADSPGAFTTDSSQADLVPVGDLAPTVSARSPDRGATGVSRTADVMVTFSEDVSGVSAVSFRLTDVQSGRAVQAVVRYDGLTATAMLDPRSILRPGHEYRVELSSAIADADGNALVPISWTFQTR